MLGIRIDHGLGVECLYRLLSGVPSLIMDILPTEFTTLLSSASLVEKRAMLIALSDNIKALESVEAKDTQNLKKYVDFVPSFVKDDLLIAGIEQELDSMKLSAPNSKGVKTFWLNSTLHSYNYTGKNNPAHLIANYPNIYKLLDMINESKYSNNKLNSCLITCYGNAKKKLDLHSDNEPEMCQFTPICNVSFGCTRKIEFVPIYGGHKDPILSFDLDNCSLNIMQPGCNQFLKHRIPPGKHIVNGNNVRYVLSFRRFIPPTDSPTSSSPVNHNIDFTENLQINESNNSADNATTVELTDAVLFAGDSHFQKLDCELLGKEKIKVLNISKGGSRICDVEKAISDFTANNCQYRIVKAFVSVGTNDIRYYTRGILHLTKPLRSLVDKIKLCFPNAKIWFQSLLPLPITNPYVVSNVEDFNKLLFDTLTKSGIFMHNVFPYFLDLEYGCYRRPDYFEDNVNNVHLNSVGLGVLAKMYIKLIHRRYFNPLFYNTR